MAHAASGSGLFIAHRVAHNTPLIAHRSPLLEDRAVDDMRTGIWTPEDHAGLEVAVRAGAVEHWCLVAHWQSDEVRSTQRVVMGENVAVNFVRSSCRRRIDVAPLEMADNSVS